MLSVLVYLLVAFGYTYALWTTTVFMGPGKLRNGLVFAGGAGPALGAVLSAWLTTDDGLDALASVVLALPSLRQLLLAVALPLLPVVAALSAAQRYAPRLVALSQHSESWGRPSLYPQVPSWQLFVGGVLIGPVLILEELGWRGWLLPELMRLGMSPTSASLAVGVFWALWHLPLFHPGTDARNPPHSLAAERPDLIPRRMLVYIVVTSACSVLLGAVYLTQPVSIWTAVLVHAVWNSSYALFRIERTARIFEPVSLVLVPFVVLVLTVLF